MSRPFQLVYGIADVMPWLFRPLLEIFAHIVSRDPLHVLSPAGMLSPADKQVLRRPSVFSAFRQMINNSVCQGARGGAHDWRIEARSWGFSLHETGIPIAIHHGEDDWLLSKEHARILASRIPDAHMTMYSGEGHTLFANRFEEMLRTCNRLL